MYMNSTGRSTTRTTSEKGHRGVEKERRLKYLWIRAIVQSTHLQYKPHRTISVAGRVCRRCIVFEPIQRPLPNDGQQSIHKGSLCFVENKTPSWWQSLLLRFVVFFFSRKKGRREMKQENGAVTDADKKSLHVFV